VKLVSVYIKKCRKGLKAFCTSDEPVRRAAESLCSRANSENKIARKCIAFNQNTLPQEKTVTGKDL